jgi:hypothetical protein
MKIVDGDATDPNNRIRFCGSVRLLEQRLSGAGTICWTLRATSCGMPGTRDHQLTDG